VRALIGASVRVYVGVFDCTMFRKKKVEVMSDDTPRRSGFANLRVNLLYSRILTNIIAYNKT
jgi:hypothetical protein